MNYTLHQLEIFLKITQLQSVTKASEALYLTQPAVSIQLKKFQEQFKTPLFEIVGRKIYITEFGEEIAKAAENILNEVQAINYKALSFQGELAGKLKIAIVSTAKYVMPYFLSDFMNQNKGVDLIMDVTNKAEVVRALENNEVDFAMVSTIPGHLKINRIELMENKLFMVAGKDYKLKGKYLSYSEFQKLPLIYREQGSATRLAMEKFIDSRKISTYKKIELKSNEALKQAVISGLGCSIMPLIGIKNAIANGELQIIPVQQLPITTNWNLIWLSSKNLTNIAKALIDYIEGNKASIIKKHFNWLDKY
ncbi:LysR family transcriptional regulator [Seonamhaeicola aphaedonensis]|uniref:DNA-binding transcriptional LysR family regulator n=1 Tax=Seonamhaeicola aphaedonensis TaxID=1461338 RepID=A0A3D9HKY8_9FLAO|nr:LysR family transcriptional regulator [Seonamhaeicola aphaedonensis]RED50138.1 DNA-binding transcriptional LysR family regulator [Seonamhaeicola aphaedonensis]